MSKYGERIRKGYKNLLKKNIVKFEKEYVLSKLKVKYYETFREKYSKIISKMNELYSEINLQE